MYFDFPAYFRFNFRAFFNTKGQHYRLTPKRFIVLILWLLLYTPAEIINRLCFVLDEIFFPGYRKQEVKKLVFIIGNPRSGTTFLHRLMFKDTQTFTSFTVWELIFAPSIIQRKAVWAVVSLVKWIGYPISHTVNSIDKYITQDKRNLAHIVKINDAEEDGHIMIHSWTCELLWALYPFADELLPFFFFDRDLPKKKQHQVMGFYKNMIQRHLYAHGGNKILLSKNPSHTSKLAALTETFPDARFINLARTPLEAMPSMMDYMSIGWNISCNPLEPYPFKDEFFQVMNFYYLYPLEFFKDKMDRCKFLKYNDLVRCADETVKELYGWLGLDYSEEFRSIVETETQAARSYKSQHTYSMDKMGLTTEGIFDEFEQVFSLYQFDYQNLELPDHVMLWKLKKNPQETKLRRSQRRYSRIMRRLGRKGKIYHLENGYSLVKKYFAKS